MNTFAAPAPEVPEFAEFHRRELTALGMTPAEIEALRHEVDKAAGQGVTPIDRGATAVRWATERRKAEQKARLAAADDGELKAIARARFGNMGLPPFPSYGDGQVGLAVDRQLIARRDAVIRMLCELIEAEREYETMRKAAGRQDTNVTREDMQSALAGLEVAKARLEYSQDQYTASVAFFEAPDRRAKAADLDALLDSVNMAAFEESLMPFIVEAGEAFDRFAAVCKRIQAHVRERENQLARGRMLARQIGLKPDAGVLPDSRHTTYMDTAFRAVSVRVRTRWVEPFLAGVRRGFGEASGI